MSSISTDLSKLPPEVLQQLSNMPSIPPPPGVIPNFQNPETSKNTQIISTGFILGLVVIFFFNRAYAKVFLMRKLTWDDATLLIAFICSLAYFSACTWGAERGRMGTHLWDISILQASSMDLLIPSYMISVITPVTFLFLKCSFFILYLQLFSSLPWMKILSYIGLVTTGLTYSIIGTLVFYWGTPKKGETWLSHLTTPDMAKELSLSAPQAIIGLIIDLYILLLPVLGVWGLRMNTKRKIGVMLIFLSGTMACVCSACSIYYRIVLDHDPDLTWHLIPVNISTLSEMFVGIICACMPSAAYATRQQNSLQARLIRSISSHFGSRYASTNGGGETSSRTSSKVAISQDVKEENGLKSTDRKYARYFNINDLSTKGSRMSGKTGESLVSFTEPTYPMPVATRTDSHTNGKVKVTNMV